MTEQTTHLNGRPIFESAIKAIVENLGGEILDLKDYFYPKDREWSFTYKPWNTIDISFYVEMSYFIPTFLEEDVKVAQFLLHITDTNRLYEGMNIRRSFPTYPQQMNIDPFLFLNLHVVDLVQSAIINYTMRHITSYSSITNDYYEFVRNVFENIRRLDIGYKFPPLNSKQQ